MSLSFSLSTANGVIELKRNTTPQVVIKRLGEPRASWEQANEQFLEYDFPLGKVLFRFVTTRNFFGFKRVVLESLELGNKASQAYKLTSFESNESTLPDSLVAVLM